MKSLRVITLCLFCMALASSKCLAADNQDGNSKRLVVWLKNGEKVFFDLEEFPKTIFPGASVVISTNSASVTYPMEDVLRYTYEMFTTGIENLKAKEVYVSQRGNTITFHHLRLGSHVQVCSLAGIVLKSGVVSDNAFTVDMEGFGSGVYLVKTDSLTCKFMKR